MVPQLPSGIKMISSISLKNFRSYPKLLMEFDKRTTIIVGDNGAGKTNVLEAVYLLATGKSFRAGKDEEMILYGEEVGRVSGLNDDKLEVVLTTGNVGGQRVAKKRYLINDLAKRKMDFVGLIKVVLFRPEDIELVLGSPSTRRNYLDSVLEQVDREYRRSILSYQKGLRQRNKLLEKIRDRQATRQQLNFWDRLLIANGDVIRSKRANFLEKVNEIFAGKDLDLKAVYEPSVISEKRIEQYAGNEVAAATTLVGPHRDEFRFVRQREGKAKKDLEVFGSRGEQRMGVFNLKLAELEFMKSFGEEEIILLLDDVFSELDHDNRAQVMKLMDGNQTIMTTADEHLLPKTKKSKQKVIQI